MTLRDSPSRRVRPSPVATSTATPSSRWLRLAAWLLVVGALGACNSSSESAGARGTVVLFEASTDLHSADHFFDFPYPSDARLTASGAPDLAGLPNPIQSVVLEGIRTAAMQRKGFPQMPVAWFRFSAPVAAQTRDVVIAAEKSSPVLLLDLDANGALAPTIASTLPADAYVPENVLAIAPRPGFVLAPKHKHAFVVLKKLGDATGQPLGVAPALAALASTPAPQGALAALYAPLWPALASLGIAAGDVAAATVFTTGDVVLDTATLASAVMPKYPATITNVHVDPNGGEALDRICELQAQITYPQFQVGAPPYDTDGSFAFDDQGLPKKQRDEIAQVTITLPKQPMPAGGYPLVVYFHGTGGRSTAIVDRGTWHYETDANKCPDKELDTWDGKTGCNTRGTGPGYVVAEHGFAMAASALPVNPQRWPEGQSRDLPEYFNINNPASLRDIFRQGVIEQRIFFEALKNLTIDPSAVAACTGVSLPQGETAYHFTDALMAQGQSMGAMYANMISAVEPRIRATVASGAGGFWSFFILQTSWIANLPGKLGLLLGIHGDYSFTHPTMALAQTGLEPSDPMVYMTRLARDPLPDHPTRSVYQPVGKGDSYFPTTVQDAVALAYRNQQAGTVVWPTMQDALALGGASGLASYPVTNDRTSLAGKPYTGVVVQYEGDGIYDPHAIYGQLDAVKYQYGCFFDSMRRAGAATVPAPAPLGTPCPTK